MSRTHLSRAALTALETFLAAVTTVTRGIRHALLLSKHWVLPDALLLSKHWRPRPMAWQSTALLWAGGIVLFAGALAPAKWQW